MDIIKPFTQNSTAYLLQQKLLRHGLTEHETKELRKHQDGSRGETWFARAVAENCDEAIIYFDLVLTLMGKEFQIDCLIIMHDELYIFEVKWTNHDIICRNCTYYFLDSNVEIITYSQQAVRTKQLFRLLLERNNLHYSTYYYHVFANPDRKIYGITPDDRCLTYHDVTPFLQQCSRVPMFYDHTALHRTLMKHALTHSRYEQTVIFDYKQAARGVFCPCSQLISKATNKNFRCRCGKTFTTREFLDIALYDFRTLFPELPISVPAIHDWCLKLVSERTIRRYLMNYYVPHGNKRATTYQPANSK
ncbi:nuclease-related domain-containing protein [Macrococcus equipercicus]|uniref:NERD domain-containing protein n=1 Tax=Macrococcus equipercicus TaxID=69967 RepID=A0A9Q9BVM7_9STAP|nr:nuclease-related domain-containing protein [Macrococcus equipercicus]UTH13222.1 NERD domain-containing protein [Macrococcus equipercicus]